MRRDVLQALALCLQANAHLGQGVDDKPAEMHGYHSTSGGVGEWEFVRNLDGVLAHLNGRAGDGTSQWLRRLRNEGVDQFLLILDAQRMAPTPGEPPRTWGIASDREAFTELWVPEWRKSPFDVNPFKVLYRSQRVNRWFVQRPGDLAKEHEAVGKAWSRLAETAAKHGDPALARTALEALERRLAGDATIADHPDLFPAATGAETQSVMADAVRAVLAVGQRPVNEEVEMAASALWAAAVRTLELAASGRSVSGELSRSLESASRPPESRDRSSRLSA